jgi:hypothetical protein
VFFFETNEEVIQQNGSALGRGLQLAERMAAAHLRG